MSEGFELKKKKRNIAQQKRYFWPLKNIMLSNALLFSNEWFTMKCF